ncbi:SH3 domain-containing protein [Ancylobacter sp. 6x-1]|uniref:SH3 domain-containing protein n=1 Tax=Ancylobacter crimeensis TaxID=2579147 RepID=A0ABT0DB50_9HYPH|nr:SH3 domain-containing protein [Ancylobacter crimeensis]MCK0197124.1 SH3 domain-containing protein [Ancylobacter crimeensis]
MRDDRRRQGHLFSFHGKPAARRAFARPRQLLLGLGALALVVSAAALTEGSFIASPAHAQDAGAAAADGRQTGKESGQPIPRFVSLKADKVNVRGGPTKDHDVAWVFTRAGLPVEITAEFENWRRIRDSEGAEGWIYHAMLSSRRTALVGSWLKKDGPVSLHARRSGDSDVKARLESGVLGNIKDCDGQWCRFFGDGFDGFIQQEKLWGVYPGEKVD